MNDDPARQYAQGGCMPGGPTWVVIHPDECLISEADVKARRIRCSRPGHPTPTSDCARAAALDATPDHGKA